MGNNDKNIKNKFLLTRVINGKSIKHKGKWILGEICFYGLAIDWEAR